MLRPAEFKSVFQNPIRSGDASFRILARPNQLLHHRLGMAVSKKACARSVGRNRIKRIVRESFRTCMVEREPECALDFVVLPTVRAKNQSNETLSAAVGAHWVKLTRKASNRTGNTMTPRATNNDPPRTIG